MLGFTLLTLSLASAPSVEAPPPTKPVAASAAPTEAAPEAGPGAGPGAGPEAVPEAGPEGPKPDSPQPATDGVRLIWDAPPGCAEEDAMQTRLDERMGVPQPQGRSRWIIARVRSEPGGRWSLRIWNAQDEELSERALVEESCEKLEEATLTIVAMTMAARSDPDPLPPPDVTDIEPAPATDPAMDEAELAALVADAPPDPPATPDDGRPVMAAPQRKPVEGAIGFGGGVGTGLFPRRSGGVMVNAGLVWAHGRIELRGNYWTSKADGVQFQPDVSGRHTLLSLAVRGCGTININDRVELPLCGGVEAGSLLVEMEDLELLHGPGQPWVSMLVGSGLNIRVHQNVAIQLLTEGVVGLVRAEHQALEGTVSKSGLVGLRAAAGLEFRFGRRSRAQATRREAGK